MPSITFYINEERYRFLLKKGKASATAKKMLEEKIDEEKKKEEEIGGEKENG